MATILAAVARASLLLASLALPMAVLADASAQPRYQPLSAEAGEVSRSLLHRYLSEAGSEPNAILVGAVRIKLGPFLAARLKSTSASVVQGAGSARLRLQLDENLAVTAEVLALNQRPAMQVLLGVLRAELSAVGSLQVRAPTPGELLLVWPNIGWDLLGGVWVAQAGDRRLLFDLPAGSEDPFLYIETLDPAASCFRMGELAAELGADCLCASIAKNGEAEEIAYQTQCPATPPNAGAPVQRAVAQERT